MAASTITEQQVAKMIRKAVQKVRKRKMTKEAIIRHLAETQRILRYKNGLYTWQDWI